jgi:hypothetical protein
MSVSIAVLTQNTYVHMRGVPLNSAITFSGNIGGEATPPKPSWQLMEWAQASFGV